MIKTVQISLAVVVGSSLLLAASDSMKRYDVKSGKIEYSIKESGNIMGMVKIKGVGKKRLVFDNYGVKDLTEENKVKKETTGGQTKVTKEHTIQYMNDGIMYRVDFNRKKIVRMENPAIGMNAMFGGGKNIGQTGESMMKSMGGKKTGTDKVLGYSCDVWELMGSKQCIYKGIPLRVETNVMGIKNTEVATKAEFDISPSNDDFKLPDFPIYDMQGNKLDKNELATMDKHDAAKAQKTSEDIAVLGAAMATAMQNSGVKPGEAPTKAQEQSMEDALMNAMLPMMKVQMATREKGLRFGIECLEKADTLKEANSCGNKIMAMMGEENSGEDDLTEWNDKVKFETIAELKNGLKSVACVKKAQTVQDAKQCMPQ